MTEGHLTIIGAGVNQVSDSRPWPPALHCSGLVSMRHALDAKQVMSSSSDRWGPCSLGAANMSNNPDVLCVAYARFCGDTGDREALGNVPVTEMAKVWATLKVTFF